MSSDVSATQLSIHYELDARALGVNLLRGIPESEAGDLLIRLRLLNRREFFSGGLSA